MARIWPAWLVIGAAALARLWFAAVVPLTDTTEARFGEMARKMVESGDWLVPLHDYGVPYLAKPPLAFWLSAMGIAVVGDGELGPRLLILAATLAFGAVLHRCVRGWLGAGAALTVVLILATSLLFFVAAAAVMTDMLLTICVTGALCAFWERYRGGGAFAETLLYVALGLGLLVKGPLAVVLVLAPIVVWSLLMGRVQSVWRRFAWLWGAALAFAIAAPWYLAAELRNPGFLQYFIVGEHLQRFLVPGWTGDLYGRAHDVPHGTVLLFFIVGALPWGLLGVPLLVAARARVRAHFQLHREFVVFWLAAAAAPLLLFTFAGNVIWPYALPALPPAALVFTALLLGAAERFGPPRLLVWAGGAAVAAFAAGAVATLPVSEAHSQRAVLHAAAELHPAGNVPLYYWRTRYFSADYYGRGRVTVVDDAGALAAALDGRKAFDLVVEKRRLDSLPPELAAVLRQVREVGPMLLLEPVDAVSNRAGS